MEPQPFNSDCIRVRSCRRHVARRYAAAAMALAIVIAPHSVRAQSPPSPGYAALGDSIEFGLGDDILSDGFGWVPLFRSFLSTVFGSAVAVYNLGEPSAQTRDIWRAQLPVAVARLQGHAPVIVTWGGGGNDLAGVATGPQAAACRQSQSCLGRLNGLLNEVEQTIDRTIAQLRRAVGPNARILMRTQYNAFRRAGCGPPEVIALAHITLEGDSNTVLDRGLNNRIRSVAQKHRASVIDLYLPFAANANALVSSDCIHPSGAGYQAIAALASTAFLSPP
jgi:lysophospholipase L1-like esterase